MEQIVAEKASTAKAKAKAKAEARTVRAARKEAAAAARKERKEAAAEARLKRRTNAELKMEVTIYMSAADMPRNPTGALGMRRPAIGFDYHLVTFQEHSTGLRTLAVGLTRLQVGLYLLTVYMIGFRFTFQSISGKSTNRSHPITSITAPKLPWSLRPYMGPV
ncbi:hypothetical protein PHPALM_32001, partial [Phytophthora palmivora]